MNLIPQSNGSDYHLAGIASSMEEELYDALASLIQNIYVEKHGGRIHTVVLTAADTCSGVSYIASCMATLLARTAGPTVLVDAHVLPKLAGLPGRLDCTHVDGGQLWYLGAAEVNRMRVNPEDEASSLKPALQSLREDFQFVIIDAPALAISNFAEVLSPIVDGTVLVAVKNRTNLHDLEAARFRLTARGGMLLGSIYNTTLNDPHPGESR